MSHEWNNQKNMLTVFFILLSIRLGRCTDDLIFEVETVGVGDYVSLTCKRPTTEYEATLYWIRIVSGKGPEFLGGTFAFDYNGVNKTPHITVKQERGTFIIQIFKTRLSDTGFYYCIKVDQLNMEFMKGIFLRLQGPEPDITDIIQVPQSDPIHEGDSVTLLCSVISNSENKTCPGNYSVYWFRPGSGESHPSLIHTHGNSGKECARNPEAPSQQKCVYSFSKNISSSDAGSYYCAVATCGQIIFGNGTEVNIKALSTWDLQKANTALFFLCAALVTSLVVIASLIYTIKKKTCDFCKDIGRGSDDQQSQQRDGESVVYSAATFTSRKSEKLDQRSDKSAEEPIIYTGVSAFTTE